MPVFFLSFLLCFHFAFGELSQKQIRDIDSVFKTWDTTETPGCALGVFHQEKILYARGYGMADLKKKIPLSVSHTFDLASQSKQFTAFAMVLLAQEGKLSLQDKVTQYLNYLPSAYSEVTILDLLHHTSGMRDYVELAALAGYPDYYTIPQALELISIQKGLNFGVGTSYRYSNTGYFLLSQIVPKVTGMSFREYSQKAILSPLQMTHSVIRDSNEISPINQAWGYKYQAGEYVPEMTQLEMVGDGSLFSSIEDLRRWDENFYHNRLGKNPEAVIPTLLTTTQLKSGFPLDYALGIRKETYKGKELLIHTGSFAGYRSAGFRFPQEKISLYTLCNLKSISPYRLTEKVAEIVLNWKTEKITSLALSKIQKKQYEGFYFGPYFYSSPLWKISFQGEKLLFQSVGDKTYTLIAKSLTSFIAEEDPRLTLDFTENGEAIASYAGYEQSRLQKLTPKPISPEQIKQRLGKYQVDELKSTLSLVQEKENVFLLHPFVKQPLSFIHPNFAYVPSIEGIITLEFIPNAQGKIVEFKLSGASTEGIRGIRLSDTDQPLVLPNPKGSNSRDSQRRRHLNFSGDNGEPMSEIQSYFLCETE